jgi:hypothetical protein
MEASPLVFVLGIHVVTLHNLRKRVVTARRGGFELATDLLGRLHGALQDRVPGPAWPDKDSDSPRFDFGAPRHTQYFNPVLLSYFGAQVFITLFQKCKPKTDFCQNYVKTGQ